MQGTKYNYDDLAWQKPVETTDNEFFYAPPTTSAAAASASGASTGPVAMAQDVAPRKRRFRF